MIISLLLGVRVAVEEAGEAGLGEEVCEGVDIWLGDASGTGLEVVAGAWVVAGVDDAVLEQPAMSIKTIITKTSDNPIRDRFRVDPLK